MNQWDNDECPQNYDAIDINELESDEYHPTNVCIKPITNGNISMCLFFIFLFIFFVFFFECSQCPLFIFLSFFFVFLFSVVAYINCHKNIKKKVKSGCVQVCMLLQTQANKIIQKKVKKNKQKTHKKTSKKVENGHSKIYYCNNNKQWTLNYDNPNCDGTPISNVSLIQCHCEETQNNTMSLNYQCSKTTLNQCNMPLYVINDNNNNNVNFNANFNVNPIHHSKTQKNIANLQNNNNSNISNQTQTQIQTTNMPINTTKFIINDNTQTSTEIEIQKNNTQKNETNKTNQTKANDNKNDKTTQIPLNSNDSDFIINGILAMCIFAFLGLLSYCVYRKWIHKHENMENNKINSKSNIKNKNKNKNKKNKNKNNETNKLITQQYSNYGDP